jgi:hypothetical protein
MSHAFEPSPVGSQQRRSSMLSTPGVLVTVHADGHQTADAAEFVHAPGLSPEPVVTTSCLRDFWHAS